MKRSKIILSVNWISYSVLVVFPCILFNYLIINSISYDISNWRNVSKDMIIVRNPYIIWTAFFISSYYVIITTIRYIKCRGIIIDVLNDKVRFFGTNIVENYKFDGKYIKFDPKWNGHYFLYLPKKVRVPRILIKQKYIDLENIISQIRKS
jgi:hypothetical protein